LIATEKLLPWKALANRGIAVLLLVLGLGVALAPESVPGLTIPGSSDGMSRMSMGSESGSPGTMRGTGEKSSSPMPSTGNGKRGSDMNEEPDGGMSR
jgi:hypothetical protein